MIYDQTIYDLRLKLYRKLFLNRLIVNRLIVNKIHAGLKIIGKRHRYLWCRSIVGRFLNYLLVPVYTIALPASSGGYGVVTNIYAWVALMLVLLTCGMETGFFRFANKGQDDPMRVYSTTLLSVSIGSLVFVAWDCCF